MLAEFAQRLICGMSITWCLLPRSQVTCGFFRIQMLVVLGLAVLLATGFAEPGDSRADATPELLRQRAGLLTAVLAFLGSLAWTLERRRAGDALIFVIAGVSLASLLSVAVFPAGLPSGDALRTGLADLSSALLLGVVTTGMLLGHWYLTAPGMSITPLSRANLYLGAAGLLRMAVALAGLWVAWNHLSGLTHWVWLSLRWAAGLLVPLLLSVMVWRILKFRNTQSATGVLYVAAVMIYLGELAAALLGRELSTTL